MIKTFLKEFFRTMAVLAGVMFFIYFYAGIFNGLERFFLSQNCERYFETLKEQNLVPHRCYMEK